MKKPDDYSSFKEQMKDISPLAQDKVTSSKTGFITKQSVVFRQKAAIKTDSKYDNFLTDGEIEFVKPDEILSFKIDGIQPNVFKNLKQAKYRFDYHLDLHRLSLEQARTEVFALISHADTEDLRCLKITHGKGTRSKQPAKLKSYVNHWLRQIEQVIAFHSALPNHGGVGSLYVLLKKPKEERKINHAKYQ